MLADILSYSHPSSSRNENTVRRNNPLRDIGAFLTPDGGAPKSFRYHPRVNTTPTQTLLHPHSRASSLISAQTPSTDYNTARALMCTHPDRLQHRRHIAVICRVGFNRDRPTDRPTTDRVRRGVCAPSTRFVALLFLTFLYFSSDAPARRQSSSSE
jgi:hypothetical protein